MANKLTVLRNVHGPLIESSYLGGVSLKKLGVEYDCSAGTIRAVLIDRGVTIRKPGRPRKAIPSKEEMVQEVLNESNEQTVQSDPVLS